jgi:hypothetical protein
MKKRPTTRVQEEQPGVTRTRLPLIDKEIQDEEGSSTRPELTLERQERTAGIDNERRSPDEDGSISKAWAARRTRREEVQLGRSTICLDFPNNTILNNGPTGIDHTILNIRPKTDRRGSLRRRSAPLPTVTPQQSSL